MYKAHIKVYTEQQNITYLVAFLIFFVLRNKISINTYKIITGGYTMKYIITFFNVLFFSFFTFGCANISFFVKTPKLIEKGKIYTIQTTINKNDLDGFSKFEIALPQGVEIKPIKTSGANFIIENNIAKFIWLFLPTTENVVIEYAISIKKDLAENELKLINRFFYMKDKKSKYISFDKNIAVEKNIELEKTANNEAYDNTYYSVQIGAFSKKLSNSKLKSLFNREDLIEYYENGMYKYRFGSFDSKEEAKKETLLYKGAFVVKLKK